MILKGLYFAQTRTPGTRITNNINIIIQQRRNEAYPGTSRNNNINIIIQGTRQTRPDLMKPWYSVMKC